jgi:hypothetical protein
MMTEEQKNALRETLYGKYVRELVETIINMAEVQEEYRMLRRRMSQIRNLVLEPEERRAPGRPRKEEP